MIVHNRLPLAATSSGSGGRRGTGRTRRRVCCCWGSAATTPRPNDFSAVRDHSENRIIAPETEN